MGRDNGSLRSPDPFIAEALAGNADFYCFGCGYNLRGLVGDPKRCPECGRLNPVDDLIVTAEMIRRQLKRLETAPTLCVAGILLTAVGITWCFFPSESDLAIGFGMAIVGPFVWRHGALGFADSCRRKPEWRRTLARFHLYAFCLFAAVIGLPVGLWFALVALGGGTGSLSGRGAWCSASLVSLLVFLILLRMVGPPIYRRATAGFEALQREVAVDLARAAQQAGIAQQRASPR